MKETSKIFVTKKTDVPRPHGSMIVLTAVGTFATVITALRALEVFLAVCNNARPRLPSVASGTGSFTARQWPECRPFDFDPGHHVAHFLDHAGNGSPEPEAFCGEYIEVGPSVDYLAHFQVGSRAERAAKYKGKIGDV